jgi:hypothetical protein
LTETTSRNHFMELESELRLGELPLGAAPRPQIGFGLIGNPGTSIEQVQSPGCVSAVTVPLERSFSMSSVIIGPAPRRIKPFYDVSKHCPTQVVYQSGKATLEFADQSHTGTLLIEHQWDIGATRIDFHSPTLHYDDISFCKAKVNVPGMAFPIEFDIATYGDGTVGAWVVNPLCIGTDHPLERVTFHLHDYPNILTDTCYQELISIKGQATSVQWSQITLEDDGWQVILQPYEHIEVLHGLSFSYNYKVLSGIGEIRKIDGAQFKLKHVIPVLDSVRVFLSFSFASWKTPQFVVGSNSTNEKTVQRITESEDISDWTLEGWLCDLHGQHLTDAYPGFCELWKKSQWQDVFLQALTWLIEATRNVGMPSGALAVAQIPLEMMAWVVFVDEKQIFTDEKVFENLSAATKLRLLLDTCGIPQDVPTSLEALSAVPASDKNAKSGPQIITQIRNSIIHPKNANRETIQGWAKACGKSVIQIHREAVLLFNWYTTLVLLRRMNYQGDYAKRLSSSGLYALERVPWAK